MPRGRGAQRVVISHSLSPAVTKVPWIPFQGQVWSRGGRARGLVWGRGRIPVPRLPGWCDRAHTAALSPGRLTV